MAPTSQADMDDMLRTLSARATELSRCATDETWHFTYINGILGRTIATVRANAEEWVRVSCKAKRIPFDDFGEPLAGEEWLAGPVVVVRNLRLLKETLTRLSTDADEHGWLAPSWTIHRETDDVSLLTFPTSRYDAMLFPGFEARTVLRHDADLFTSTREAYVRNHATPGVSLVLGAGNVSSIPPMDALYKIFAHGNTCIVKMNPVNEYLTPVFLKAFAPLIDDGLLRFVTGGAEEGTHLVRHDAVTDVHVTGSEETHDCIVWGGPAPIRHQRKLRNTPILAKPITSELGNISPVMIVPGNYAEDELKAMAWNVTTQVVNNGSFNCNAAKMLVLAKGWAQRERFLTLLKRALYATRERHAYYPGAQQRYAELTRFGARIEKLNGIDPETGEDLTPHGTIPWTIVHVDAADVMNPLFRQEPFCAMLSVTELAASDAAEFLASATSFCNDTLWGTLNTCIMIDPRTEKACGSELDQAVRMLRYGTVGINHWPALGYGFVSTPWGGHPSATLRNIQSGLGWVHNTYLIPDDQIEKTVIRGPLVVKPKPAWFANNRMTHVIGRKLVDFEASPSWLKLPGLIAAALRG